MRTLPIRTTPALRAALLLAATAAGAVPAASAADWTALAPAPTARTEGQFAVHDGGAWHFNGFDARIDLQTSVERYDFANDRWEKASGTSTGGSMPNGVTHNGLVMVGDEAWLIGGRVGDHPGRVTDRVWIMDLDTREWREGPRLPVPFAGGGAALVGDTLHVFGGVDARAECDVATHVALDVDAPGDGWRNLGGDAPFPNPRNHFATVVLDGLVYAVGGQYGHDRCASVSKLNEQSRLVHAYDPSTNRWTRRADLPWAQSHAEPSSFAYANRLWSVGGLVEGDRVMTYSPDDDAWTWRKDLKLPTRLMAPGARIRDDRLYVFGGGAPNVRHPRTESWVTPVPGLSSDDRTDEDPPTDDDDAPTDGGDGSNGGTDDAPNADGSIAYRLNVGGPAVTDGEGRAWQADEGFPGRWMTTPSKTWGTNRPATGAGAPSAVLTTERFSANAATGLGWSFPVTPGEHEVRLHFAEIWSRAFTPGVRRFAVEIEGRTVTGDLDVYAEAGARKGLVKRYRVTSDDSLELRLGHIVQHPALKGIEIVALGGNGGDGDAQDAGSGDDGADTGGGASGDDGANAGGSGDGGSNDDGSGGGASAPATLVADVDELVFSAVVGGAPERLRLVLTNPGDAPLTIDDLVLGGGDADAFSVSLSNGATIGAGDALVVDVDFAPVRAGSHDALLALGNDGADGVVLIGLEGSAAAPADGTSDGTLASVWRVNVGGEPVLGSDGVLWSGDVGRNVAAYTRGESNKSSTDQAVVADASVPASVDDSVFRTDRWSPDPSTGLEWSFPVAPGRHEVRLYFAEIWSGAFADGVRRFDVDIEGDTVLEALDVHRESGGARRRSCARHLQDAVVGAGREPEPRQTRS